jgi:hypothetical protein
MNKLIERCEALLPSKEWERFRDLPYDAELMAKQDFVMEVLRGEPAPFPIAGFWFGLFNPVYDESTTADIYFGCGRTFDPDDEEWPTSIEFFPRTAISTPACWPRSMICRRAPPSETTRSGRSCSPMGPSWLELVCAGTRGPWAPVSEWWWASTRETRWSSV